MATETDFLHALAHVLASEGGYVNDPDDPGGATNFGVTQRVYDGWRSGRGLGVRSVREMARDEAAQIYRAQYWTASGAAALPMPLALIHFDTAVNMGVGAANRLLATSGRDTTAYLAQREARYRALAAGNPSLAKFLGGWLNRVASLRRVAGDVVSGVVEFVATAARHPGGALLVVGGLLLWLAGRRR